MKAFTFQTKGFLITAVIVTVIGLYNLYTAVRLEDYEGVMLISGIYGVLMFLSGFGWGYFDSERKSRFDLSFMYHLITYCVVNIIGIPIMFVTLGINPDFVVGALSQVFGWGLGLLLHYILVRRTIKGMTNHEVFQ